MKKIIVFSTIFVLLSIAAFASDISDLTVGLIETGFDSLGADIAVGEPIQLGDKYVIPLFEANTFFLGGGGGRPVMGAGGFGNLNLVPYAVLIISDDDFVVKPVTNKVPFLEQLVGILPDVLPMIMQFFTLDTASVVSEDVHKEPVLIEEQSVGEEKHTVNNEDTTARSLENIEKVLLENPTEDSFKALKGEINELMEIAPENPRVYALNGYVTLRLLANASPLEQMKYAMQAQNSINKALAMDSSDYFANLANGWLNLYSPMGQISNSISGFKNAMNEKPDQIEPYFGIVEACVKAGDTKTAKEFAEKGKVLSPDSSNYFDELLNK
ncbi:MAG TPA: hypothetical protein PK466_05455 [Thermotogota bacterium]|nr:hypothetical protein [Thermotogota bacterium]HPR95754.1 hypothetical protein [Thermotogota bacterium]